MGTDAAAEKRNKSAVPSVEKALDVIELLADAPEGLTMNEIVERLGRTMGEIYRVVVYLAERGYLEQSGATSRYSLTLRLFEISHRYDPTERLLSKAMPLLEQFRFRTDQSCHLGVLSERRVLILASVPSPRPAGYSVRTGAIFDLQQTSTGNVILAFSADSVRAEFIEGLPEGARGPAMARLKEIVEQGYEDRNSTLVDGVRNLSAPVFDSRGVVAAITSGYIGQNPQKVSTEEALGLLRGAAAMLSHALGYSDKTSE